MAKMKCILATVLLLCGTSSACEHPPTLSYSYPQTGNFNHVQLSCLLDESVPPTATHELHFQRNGLDIENQLHILNYYPETAIITFIITQKKEGLFSCSLDHCFSFNTIALAAEPMDDFTAVQHYHRVELPDADSVVSTELQCDIQPGALRQKYSAQWRQLKHNDNTTIDYTFNLTLHISSSQNGSKYQCEVTIHHDNIHNETYAGAVIIILTKVNDNGSPNLLIFYLIITVSVVLPLLCIVVLVVIVLSIRFFVWVKEHHNNNLLRSTPQREVLDRHSITNENQFTRSATVTQHPSRKLSTPEPSIDSSSRGHWQETASSHTASNATPNLCTIRENEHGRLDSIYKRASYAESANSGYSATSQPNSMLADLQNKVGACILDSWFTFGIQLQVPSNKLEYLSRTKFSPMECFTKVCIHWARNQTSDYPYNWETVVKVLRAPALEMNNLAEEIEKTMVLPGIPIPHSAAIISTNTHSPAESCVENRREQTRSSDNVNSLTSTHSVATLV